MRVAVIGFLPHSLQVFTSTAKPKGTLGASVTLGLADMPA